MTEQTRKDQLESARIHIKRARELKSPSHLVCVELHLEHANATFEEIGITAQELKDMRQQIST